MVLFSLRQFNESSYLSRSIFFFYFAPWMEARPSQKKDIVADVTLATFSRLSRTVTQLLRSKTAAFYAIVQVPKTTRRSRARAFMSGTWRDIDGFHWSYFKHSTSDWWRQCVHYNSDWSIQCIVTRTNGCRVSPVHWSGILFQRCYCSVKSLLLLNIKDTTR